MANKTLDIIRQLTLTAKGESRERKIASILSTAFMRSVMIYAERPTICPYQDEDVSFFRDKHELATVEWVKRNNKVAGAGTSTLRESKAIYFPMENEHGTVAIGFSCVDSEMSMVDTMIFSEVENVLRAIF